MDLGSIVHQALEYALSAYYNTGYTISLEEIYAVIDNAIDLYDTANRPELLEVGDPEGYHWNNQEEIDKWDEMLKTGRGISKRTIKYLDVPNHWRTETIQWNGKETPLIEFDFEYPLVENQNIVGRIDWVARNVQDGQVYLIDWKTRQKITAPNELGGENMNLQMSIYQYVLNSLGLDIFGTITYQIRSMLPQVPKTTAKDRIAKSNITTDWATYRQAIIDNGEDPNDLYYEDMRHELQMQGVDQWFAPTTVLRTKYELESRWKTVRLIASKMLNDTEPAKYETPYCVFCPFFALCYGEDNGQDLDYIKKNQYTARESRSELVGTMENEVESVQE